MTAVRRGPGSQQGDPLRVRLSMAFIACMLIAAGTATCRRRARSPIQRPCDLCRASLLNSREAQVRATWARITFTGKGTPPKELKSDAEVKAFVAADPRAIGYIDASAVDPSVKAVLKL